MLKSHIQTNFSGQTCVNQPGSYDCECPPGYTGNGYFCLNKTEQLKPCDPECSENQICVYEKETDSFECACAEGYNATTNEILDCVDVNECLAAPCGKNTTCSNFLGGYECICDQGYESDQNGRCIDIDECADGKEYGSNT